MPWLETIKLSFGNVLIIGHAPQALTAQRVSEKILKEAEQLEVESFGFFDSNTANYNTYYPDVTEEDLKPKDNEFIYPVFRSLSEVVVHKEWNPVDFSRNGVLRKSLSLLKGSTVNVDHETSVGNAMGAVVDTFWQEAYKAKNGVQVPAGINSKFKLDGKSHPRVARAIMMDPPAIHSTSVTVQFNWEKSHASMTQEEFFRGLGTFDKDGKLITRVATEVKRYHEISLVGHGADPYAQLINDKGEITNPTWGDISYNSANPGKPKATKFFMFDFKTDLVSNSENPTIPAPSNNNDNNKPGMKELLLQFAAIVGIATLNENDEQATAEVLAGITSLVNEKTRLTGELTTANTEVSRLKPLAEAAGDSVSLTAQVKEFTDAFRAEVTRNYSVIAKGSPVEAVTKLIEKADYATLKALNEQYKVQLESDFKLSCKECGSENVSRASAQASESEGGEDKGKKAFTSLEDYQASRKAGRNTAAIAAMHK